LARVASTVEHEEAFERRSAGAGAHARTEQGGGLLGQLAALVSLAGHEVLVGSLQQPATRESRRTLDSV